MNPPLRALRGEGASRSREGAAPPRFASLSDLPAARRGVPAASVIPSLPRDRAATARLKARRVLHSASFRSE
jgi:hypothetical protein